MIYVYKQLIVNLLIFIFILNNFFFRYFLYSTAEEGTIRDVFINRY